MVQKAYDAEEEIISENPEDIVDEDIVEEGDEDLEEESIDEDLVGEEDEDIEEEDEDLEEEASDEDVEEGDEDLEESEDEDLIGEEDEDIEEEDEDISSCGDSDPLASEFNRIIAKHNKLKNMKLQKQAIDELSSIITRKVEARDSLVKKVVPLIGNFKYKHMTADQVAKYACDKLDIKVSAKNAKAALKGYLSAVRHNKATKLYTLDSAIRSSYSEDAAIEEYLKGEK